MITYRYRIERERRGLRMRWAVYTVSSVGRKQEVSEWGSWQSAMNWVDQYVSGPRFGYVRR